MSGAIRLTVPSKDRVENPHVILKPSLLKKWEAQLPYANLLGVGEKLLHALKMLNRYPGKVVNRLDLMQIYHKPYHMLLKNSRRSVDNKSGGIHPKMGQIAKLTNEISAEMAYGYKLHINDMLEKGKAPRHMEQLRDAIYWAMDTLMMELMYAYERYNYEPSITWREMYQLYAAGARKQISNLNVEDKYAHSQTITTIESQLKKAVLLTLLDPYRLLEGDVWSAYEYLCFWATKAEIEPLNSKSKAAGRFIMDLWGIKHVRPFNPETTDPAESAGRYHLLNTLPLNQMVNRHLLECQKDKEAIPLGMKNLQQIEAAQLIRRMLLSWHLRPERRSKRYERYGWLKAACGVSAAHHYLHLDQSKEASTPKIDQLDLEVAGLSPMESLEDSDVPSGQFEHKKVNFEFFRWRQINISDGGLAAHVNKPFPSILEVGQLVLMEHESDDQEGWLVAVIRRMMHIDNERIEIGVQFMPGIIQPVSVRSMVVGSSRVDFQPSLLISNERGDQTLVTPCSMYTPGREFLLEDRSRVSRVGAGKLIESTHAFDRFFIHALLKKEAAEGNLQAATLQ